MTNIPPISQNLTIEPVESCMAGELGAGAAGGGVVVVLVFSGGGVVVLCMRWEKKWAKKGISLGV